MIIFKYYVYSSFRNILIKFFELSVTVISTVVSAYPNKYNPIKCLPGSKFVKKDGVNNEVFLPSSRISAPDGSELINIELG